MARNADGLSCECHEVHGDAVTLARSNMPNEWATGNIADLFKLFGGSTRLKILLALNTVELCVCDICEILDMNKSAVSHQLRVLKDANLVASRKEGRNVFYSLCDDHVKVIIETAMEHVSERRRSLHGGELGFGLPAHGAYPVVWEVGELHAFLVFVVDPNLDMK